MPDHENTLRGLGDYRSGLQKDLEAVTAELRGHCIQAHKQGMQKIRICELAGISRPTLDEWLNRQEER